MLFVGAYIMLGKGYPAQYAFAVSVCIGAALLLAMFISSAVGTLIPMFFKRIGGIPVKRDRSESLTDTLAEEFQKRDQMELAIAPEGTRKPVTEWKKGFYFIAAEAATVRPY